MAELEHLHVQVSLLSCYEKRGRGAWNDWMVGTHGITIEFVAEGKRYSGTYLPHIPLEEGAPASSANHLHAARPHYFCATGVRQSHDAGRGLPQGGTPPQQ